MVNKLFKHECFALGRVLFPVYLITLGIAVLTRCVQFFYSDTVVYRILFGSSVVFLTVAIVACSTAALVMAIIRYYRNLFTGEGYLTFTLPATPTQHLFVKFSAALCFQAMAWVTAILSIVIAASWDLLHEVYLAADYLIQQVLGTAGFHFWLYVAEFVLVLITSSISSLLLYYTCITIGQTAKKNRVLMAVVVYFIYYAASQFLGTIFSAIFAIAGEPIVEAVVEVFQNYPIPSIHVLLCSVLLFGLLFSALLFAICRYIINRKLNLE